MTSLVNQRIFRKPHKLTDDFHWVKNGHFDFYFCFWGLHANRFRERNDENVSQCFKKIRVASPEVEELIRSIDWVKEHCGSNVNTFCINETEMSEIYLRHKEAKSSIKSSF